MEQYRNARENLKSQLTQKLMCDRFGWEINIGDQNFIVEIPITKEEYSEKLLQIDKIIRELIYELDVYTYRCESDPENRAIPIPTIFNLLTMSTEFDDTPIDTSEAYEVDPNTIVRTVDSKWVGEYEVPKIDNMIRLWTEEDLDPDFALFHLAIKNGDIVLIKPSDHPQDQDNCSEPTCCSKDDWGFTFKPDLEPLIDRCFKKGLEIKDGHVVKQN